MIKKADIVLIILLIIFAGTFVFIFDFTGQQGGSVIIDVDGKRYGIYDLSIDNIIAIKNKYGEIINTVEIKDNRAKMIQADCKDNYCIGQGFISHSHETITCLPNKVVIEITGSTESEIDAVAQ